MLLTSHDRLAGDLAVLLQRHGHKRDALLPILLDLRRSYGTISDEAMQLLADAMGLSAAQVASVISFYHFLDDDGQGHIPIWVCRCICCQHQRCLDVAQRLRTELGIDFGAISEDGRFSLGWANCLGMCDQAPALLIGEQVYTRVHPEDVPFLLRACQEGHAWHAPEEASDVFVRERPLTFKSIATGAAWHWCLNHNTQAVIQTIEDSGLRGRGGAGFPTAVKWRAAATCAGDDKVVICNADEGEPGTFKDRMILHDFPHLVLEGMLIAARAIGAHHGIMYLRGEYAYLRDQLESSIRDLHANRLLDCQQTWPFQVQLRLGAGAYVCGEETALIESLEGRRGEARNRPPFPVQVGLHGMPSLIHNVETLAWVPTIVVRGSDWFREHGTHASTGFKLFSVAGDCQRPGIYEMPWGRSLRDLLEEVGGEHAQAVLVGGAAGRCVPASDFDRRLSFEDLATGGALFIIAPDRDLLAVAEDLLRFFCEESCGQCTPCRNGCPRLLNGIQALRAGHNGGNHIAAMRQLGETMQLASKCGLGQSAPRALLSILDLLHTRDLGEEAP